MKDFSGQILGLFAAGDAPGQECIDPIKILLLELRKAGRFILRRLNQEPLAAVTFQDFHLHSPQFVFYLVNGRQPIKSHAG